MQKINKIIGEDDLENRGFEIEIACCCSFVCKINA